MEIAAAGEDQKALRRIARALLSEGYKGNIAAIAIIADRLDGSFPQPVGGSDDLGPRRLHITWGNPTPEGVEQRAVVAAAASSIDDLSVR